MRLCFEYWERIDRAVVVELWNPEPDTYLLIYIDIRVIISMHIHINVHITILLASYWDSIFLPGDEWNPKPDTYLLIHTDIHMTLSIESYWNSHHSFSNYEIPSPTHTHWFIMIFASLFQFTFTLIFISLFLMIHIDIRIIFSGDEWNPEPDICLLIFIWLFLFSHIEIRITLSNHKIPSPTPPYRLKLKFISVPCWHSYQYSYWFTLSFESFSEIPNPTPICWYDMNRKTIVMAVYYSSDCNGATLISPRPQSLPLSLSLSPTLSHT